MIIKTAKPRYIFRAFVIVIVLISLAILVFKVKDYVFVSPVALSETKTLTQPKADVTWPDYGSGAVGAVGFDGILSHYGDQAARPIASITKVITALLVLETKPLNENESGPNIILSQNDVDIYNEELNNGAAVKPVVAGNSVSEKQALEVMLFASAANYSKTLAIWAYGSFDKYITAANKWLSDHDLKQTKVVDTSGLLSENVSTPSDLVKLAKLANANSALASIVSTPNDDIADLGLVSNGNQVLGKAGINGIKNGWTSDAGACLLFSSDISIGNETITIVGAILGGDQGSQVGSDTIKLIESMEFGFHNIKLTSIGQKFGSYTSSWGQTTELVATKDLSAVVWSNDPVTIKVKADDLKKVKSGENKGTLEIKIGDQVTKQSLMAKGSITDPGIVWHITNLK